MHPRPYIIGALSALSASVPPLTLCSRHTDLSVSESAMLLLTSQCQEHLLSYSTCFPYLSLSQLLSNYLFLFLQVSCHFSLIPSQKRSGHLLDVLLPSCFSSLAFITVLTLLALLIAKSPAPGSVP